MTVTRRTDFRPLLRPDLIYMDLYVILSLITALCFVGFAYLTHQSVTKVSEAVDKVTAQLAKQQTAVAEANTDKLETGTFRLQACERLTLMTERINVSNLLLRLPAPADVSAKEYTARLLLTIREEYEYNVTQQIYVSDALWSVLLQARDNVSQLIVRAAEGADTAAQVANRLRYMAGNQPQDAIALAQAALRREATGVLL